MYRKIYQFLQKRNVGTRFQIYIYMCIYTHTHSRIQSEGGILKAVLRQSRWHIDSSVVPSRFGTTHGWRKNTDARGERFLFREENPASAKMFTMDFDLTIRAPSRERKKNSTSRRLISIKSWNEWKCLSLRLRRYESIQSLDESWIFALATIFPRIREHVYLYD